MNAFNSVNNSQRLAPAPPLGLPLQRRDERLNCQGQLLLVDGCAWHIAQDVGLCRTRLSDLLSETLIEGNFELHLLASSPHLVAVIDQRRRVRVLSLDNAAVTDLGITTFGTSAFNLPLEDGFLLYRIDDDKMNDTVVRVSADFTPLWSYFFEEYVLSAVISPDGSRVVLLGEAGGLICLDAASGQPLWYRQRDELGIEINGLTSVSSHPAIFDNLIITGSANLHVLAVDLASGEPVWTRQLAGDSNYPCVSANGTVYKVSGNVFTAIDARSGALLAETRLESPHENKDLYGDLSSKFCTLSSTHLWAVNANGLLYAVNLQTQRIDWHDTLESGYSLGEPFLIHDGQLYIHSILQPGMRIYRGS